MFAFPLAFEFGDGGAVVAMLGLLISCCAAGWGMMAARRVGHTWPGLPARGSGDRPDWRVIALYVVMGARYWSPSPCGAWPACADAARGRRRTPPGDARRVRPRGVSVVARTVAL